MARPVSSLESHPQRQKIVEAIVAETPYRLVSAWTNPKVSPAAISRFASRIKSRTADTIHQAKVAIANIDKGVTPELEQAVTRAALTAAADPFVARILKHQATVDAEIGTAAGDARGIAALVSTDLKGLELHARLTGRLETRSDAPTTNLHVYLGIPRLDPGRSVPQQLGPADVEFIDAPADVGNRSDESDS